MVIGDGRVSGSCTMMVATVMTNAMTFQSSIFSLLGRLEGQLLNKVRVELYL